MRSSGSCSPGRTATTTGHRSGQRRAVVTPGIDTDPDPDAISSSRYPGVRNDVSQTVLITVTKLTTNAPWLIRSSTSMDRLTNSPSRPPCPRRGTTTRFSLACASQPPATQRWTIASASHTTTRREPLGPGNARLGNIEIITEVPADVSQLGLTCTQVSMSQSLFERATSLLLPERLYATGTPATSGGKVRTYSPFAAVDPLLTVSANSATTQSGTAGAAVTAPPSVKVQTRLNTLVDLVSIGFTPAAGSRQRDRRNPRRPAAASQPWEAGRCLEPRAPTP